MGEQKRGCDAPERLPSEMLCTDFSDVKALVGKAEKNSAKKTRLCEAAVPGDRPQKRSPFGRDPAAFGPFSLKAAEDTSRFSQT